MKLKLNIFNEGHSLLEVSRRDLVVKSRVQDKKRFSKRMNYQVSNFRGVDLQQLFENDYFVFNTPINGYTCTIAFPGVFTSLKNVIKSTNGKIDRITLQMVIKALRTAFDATDDVKVNCTCADFCLHPDTEIKLLDGRVLPIKDLYQEFIENGDNIWVYSVDPESHDFRPGHVTDVWVSGYVNELTKVTLDNGESVLTTPEHKYMLRDGSYEEAQNLQEGQSLMPLYFQNNSMTKGYETVKYNSRSHGYNSVYKEVAKYELQDQIEEARERSGEDVIVIHYRNFNKLDNRPENLYPMGKIEHWRYHADHIALRRKEDLDFDQKLRESSRKHCKDMNSNPTEAMIKSRSELGKARVSEINSDPEKRAYTTKRARESKIEWWKEVNSLPEDERREVLANYQYSDERREISSQAQKKVWESYTDEERQSRGRINSISLNGENGEKASERVKEYWNSLSESEYQKRCQQNSNSAKSAWQKDPVKIVKGRSRKVLQKIVDSQEDITEENYLKYRTRNAPLPTKYWNCFDDMVEDLGFKNYNHKVVSVEKLKLEENIPVYDLTVDHYENFLVNAGVILHNCYRFAYIATVNGYKYGPPEKRPSDITNPDDSLGATCKHLSLLLSNKQWLVKAASVVNSFIKAYPDKAYFYLYDTYPALDAPEEIPEDEPILEPDVPEEDDEVSDEETSDEEVEDESEEDEEDIEEGDR